MHLGPSKMCIDIYLRHKRSLAEALRLLPSVRPSIRPSVCPSIRLSVCPFVHLSLCLSIICMSVIKILTLVLRLSNPSLCYQESSHNFESIITIFGKNMPIPLIRKLINFESSNLQGKENIMKIVSWR